MSPDPVHIARAIASLNDVVAELACGLASGDDVTKGWAYTVVDTLGMHSLQLGVAPAVDVEQIAHWKGDA